jgi:hypothetical protein
VAIMMRQGLHLSVSRLGFLLVAGWVLWFGSPSTSTSTGMVFWLPRDGYETRAQCSAAQQMFESQVAQEKKSSTFIACFPDVFDPRANASTKGS